MSNVIARVLPKTTSSLCRGFDPFVERINMIKASIKIALLLISTTIFATEVIETGAVLGEYPVIRWMDNQRVIFLAASGQTCDRKDKPDSYKQPLNRIAIFDTRTRQLSWHGDVGVNGLCYADGNIAYARRLVSDGLCPKDDWIYLRGRFGEEKEQQPTTSVNTYSCLPEAEKNAVPPWLESAKKSGRVFRPLKPEHGWLEMFAGDPNYSQQMTYPLAIHPPGKEDKPIAIDKRVFQPWLDQSYHVRFVRYEAFKNAYLLALDDTSGKGRENGNFWWLHPDGTTEQILTYGRSGYWQEVRFNGVMPIKNGLLAFSGDTYPRSDKSGVYRKNSNGELSLVARGWLESHSVSPDGCKVALGIDPRGFRIEGPRRLQLHVLNACN